MRVILDTNILCSALLTPGGPRDRLLGRKAVRKPDLFLAQTAAKLHVSARDQKAAPDAFNVVICSGLRRLAGSRNGRSKSKSIRPNLKTIDDKWRAGQPLADDDQRIEGNDASALRMNHRRTEIDFPNRPLDAPKQDVVDCPYCLHHVSR